MDSRPSVKHVLGVLEWFCMLSEKNTFSKKQYGFFTTLADPPVWQKTIRNTFFFWTPSLITTKPWNNHIWVQMYVFTNHMYISKDQKLVSDRFLTTLWWKRNGETRAGCVLCNLQGCKAATLPPAARFSSGVGKPWPSKVKPEEVHLIRPRSSTPSHLLCPLFDQLRFSGTAFLARLVASYAVPVPLSLTRSLSSFRLL